MYEEEYTGTFDKFPLERIQELDKHFLTSGDYRQGIAGIRCTDFFFLMSAWPPG
jgi:hypothetical protein